MELKRYLQIIGKGWWLVLPAILLSISVGLFITYNQSPVYRTKATFIVSPNVIFSEDPNDVLRGLTYIGKREGVMSTYVEIASSSTVRNAVYEELGLTKAQKAHLQVSSELLSSTNIIEISVESDDPALAQVVADAIGEQTTKYVKGLYEIYDMKPLDPAYLPSSPFKPQKTENLILATLLGAIIGIGAAFLLDYLGASGDVMGLNILDSATGIYNRSYFLQRLSEELSRSKRHQRPLSLALMSVENLDVVLDAQSHLRDEALRQVGVFMKQSLRTEDLVARFEDNTFALLFPDTTGSDAELLLQSLHTRIEWNVFELNNGAKLNLVPSSGIVTYDFNGTGRDELVSRLTKTLQYARDEGYGKVYLLPDDN
ncbi:MAG: diguanylate cyclase [Anaerolineae bacterium]|nr:diguanylate cyclase [Anaerolineae bacterium]